MARAIDADGMKNAIREWQKSSTDFRTLEEVVDGQPTIEPVNHGKWEVGCAGKIRICGNCKESFDDTCNFIERDWQYCPNCGSRMDGE